MKKKPQAEHGPKKVERVKVDPPKPLPVRPIIEEAHEPGKQVYAFIDASNLFWGGKESIGFRISYSRLLKLLQARFGVTKAFYYGGVRIFDFDYSILDNKPLDLAKLSDHLKALKERSEPTEAELIEKTLGKINFYQLVESYGYTMKIKPAKVFYDEDDENQERPILKANCDVDMTFDVMRYMSQYTGVVMMTGDGDFAPIMNYLKNQGRTLKVVSRWERTAKEIRQISGDDFVDLGQINRQIRY